MLVGSTGVLVTPSFFSPCLDAGRMVEIEIWVAQLYPLFSAKLASFFPYVTRYARTQELDPISMACDGLKFLAWCLLIPRASVQWSSSWIHMCCFYFACVSHSPAHSHYHAGLNLSPFISLQEKFWVKYRGYRGERGMPLWNTQPHFTLSSPLCSSPPPCWIGRRRIQIPLLCSKQSFPLPWSLGVSQHTHPGTSLPTPRGLIKSFLLTNYVVSLRGILKNQISPSHNYDEVFPLKHLGCSNK